MNELIVLALLQGIGICFIQDLEQDKKLTKKQKFKVYFIGMLPLMFFINLLMIGEI